MRVAVYKVLEEGEAGVIEHSGYSIWPVDKQVESFRSEASPSSCYIHLLDVEGVNWDHCMMLAHRILNWEPYKPEHAGIPFTSDDVVYCDETCRYGHVMSLTDDYIAIEFSNAQGKPVHLYNHNDWWETLVKVNTDDVESIHV